jgi:Zn-dependent protease
MRRVADDGHPSGSRRIAVMFRLLGFDVHVQSGFIIFMVMIVAVNPGAFGLWLAGSLSVFTIIHELGHALAARRTGAHAEISLGFLAGYASYRPTRELSRLERAGISFAGPFVEISIGLAVLLAMGVNPLDRDSISQSPATQAIWWAGPVLALLNLIPVLPLDGGHIAAVGLDRLLPGRSHKLMLYFSLAVTSAGAVYMVASSRRGFVFFIGFLMITQIQMLQAGRPRSAAASPWALASKALDAGKPHKARRTLVAALSHEQPSDVPGDLSLDPERATALIDLLPRPLPFGNLANEYVLANLLVMTGRYDDAAHYAAATYERVPNTLSATIVARCAAALGDQSTAIGWLRTAATIATSPGGLATTIDRAPELADLRHHPDVAAIRASLSPAV